MKWTVTDNYIYGVTDNYIGYDNLKVAGFDLDHTIIKPKMNKRFSTTSDDWLFYHPDVDQKIRKYYNDEYNIVIVSNQKGISTGKVKLVDWQKKLELIEFKLGFPFIVLASMKNDAYRKPRTMLWDQFIDYNKEKSFYYGDAGGLPKRIIKGVKLKKDFSDSDLKFAYNLGIKFKHRDEFIFDKQTKYKIKYPITFKQIPRDKYSKFIPKKKELIINVGYPGSGKSYYTKIFILKKHDYEHINQDRLKTKKKCFTECIKAMKKGKSVIIDNTNPDCETRQIYLDLAKKYSYRTRCLYFNTSYDISYHNTHFRNYMTKNRTKIIPIVVYRIFRKKFVEPCYSEGFDLIETINFKLRLSKKLLQYYEKYYF